jgi:small subunit ribosomal protein S8
MTDPIADMITRIKNALLAGHAKVEMPHSKIKEALAKILVEEGYISEMKIRSQVPQSVIEIGLKYIGKIPAITDVRRVSKPGRRSYTGAKSIPSALGGYGITIVSTSKGVMTGTNARKSNAGGEVLCQVW